MRLWQTFLSTPPLTYISYLLVVSLIFCALNSTRFHRQLARVCSECCDTRVNAISTLNWIAAKHLQSPWHSQTCFKSSPHCYCCCCGSWLCGWGHTCALRPFTNPKSEANAGVFGNTYLAQRGNERFWLAVGLLLCLYGGYVPKWRQWGRMSISARSHSLRFHFAHLHAYTYAHIKRQFVLFYI